MTDFLATLRTEALSAPPSGIVDVMNYGRLREGLIPLWAGEGDLPTPAFVCDAATRSLAAGETFYTWQRGIPELREALARYHAGQYGGDFAPERFFVTASGMQAIQIVATALLGPGDEAIMPTPAWPNSPAAVGIRGATVVEVPMTFGNRGWTLDLDRLAAAVGPKSKAIVLNSPANPTGWTATRDELAAILDLARRHGLWIVADEVYSRFVWDGSARAPSFHDVADADDKVIYVNTFSKNWAMTGWRIGWIEAPTQMGDVIENLIQYSTSGVTVFVQRGAVAALDHGEGFLAHQTRRIAESRKILCDAIAATGRARFVAPTGAFYLFFGVEGEDDTSTLGRRLVDEAGIGLAPGTAFGPAGNGFLRLCYARGPESMREASARLADWLTRRPVGA
ncbi:MAG: pyridoxal phosphate-dependent aminotransferase [Phyllobacteriaceae bacterium]|nr:pyridoxal phosphate-dependent aminotransferase [Phyllobacteriaceae bacterium]